MSKVKYIRNRMGIMSCIYESLQYEECQYKPRKKASLLLEHKTPSKLLVCNMLLEHKTPSKLLVCNI